MSQLSGLMRHLYCAFISIGILTALVIPPFQGTDEAAHWVAGVAALHADGRMCGEDVALVHHFNPTEVHKRPEVKIEKGLFASVGKLQSTCADSTAFYASIFSYPFILAGKVFASTFRGGTLLEFYLSRICAGFFIFIPIILLSEIGMKENNRQQLVFLLFSVFLLMSPIGLQQSFSINSDVVTIASSILMGGAFLSLSNWTVSAWFLFAAFGFFALMTKPILAPVLLVTPLFVEPKKRRIALIVCFAQLVCAFALTKGGSAIRTAGQAVANPSAQWTHFANHPAQVLWVLLRDSLLVIINYGDWLFWLGYGDYRSANTSRIAYCFLIIAIFFVFLSALPSDSDIAPRLRQTFWKHILFIGAWVGSLIVVSLYLYITWTPPGALQVEGLQGRYFIPHILVMAAYILKFARPFSLNARFCTPTCSKLYCTSALFFFVLYSVFKTLDTLGRYW